MAIADWEELTGSPKWEVDRKGGGSGTRMWKVPWDDVPLFLTLAFPVTANFYTVITNPLFPNMAVDKVSIDPFCGEGEAPTNGILAVRLATADTLPTFAYSNGTAGVGATITGTTNGALSVDGALTASGDDILVKDESNQAYNGWYTCTRAGSVSTTYQLTRAPDFDEPFQIHGRYFLVQAGTQAGTGWLVTSMGPFIVGTTAIPFSLYSGLVGANAYEFAKITVTYTSCPVIEHKVGVSGQYVTLPSQSLGWDDPIVLVQTTAAADYATTAALPACNYDNGVNGLAASLFAQANGALVVDLKTVAVGQTVLVKDQASKPQNGLYVVRVPGDAGTAFVLERDPAMDETDEVQGFSVTVTDGAANQGKKFTASFTVQIPLALVIGTTDITFTEIHPPTSSNIKGDDAVAIAPNFEHTLSFNMVAYPPWTAIRRCIGKVNAYTYTFPLASGTGPAETLLFSGLNASHDMTQLGTAPYKLEYKLSEKNANAFDPLGNPFGWNHFVRPESGEYERLLRLPLFVGAADRSGLIHDIEAADTFVTVATFAYPTVGSFYVKIEDEILEVVSVAAAGDNLTLLCGRGALGSVKADHSAGTRVEFYSLLTLSNMTLDSFEVVTPDFRRPKGRQFLIKIDDEIMAVNSSYADTVGNVATGNIVLGVLRAVRGTTLATHMAGTKMILAPGGVYDLCDLATLFQQEPP